MKKWILYISIVVLGASCAFDDEAELPPVEERIEDATSTLIDQLTDPNNGWRLDYQPTPTGGIFLLLMEFDEDGTVRIRSDLGVNDGEFRDQTIPYRIDSRQGLELVLETYGIFHYLFEQEQATFGGEFEFVYITETSNGDLVFASKTDGAIGQNTNLIFTPASLNDLTLITTDVLGRLDEINFREPGLGSVGNYVPLNMYLPQDNTTISLTVDLDNRRLKVHGAAVGETFEEIIANGVLNIDGQTTYTVISGNIVLAEPARFNVGGTSFELDQIPVGESSTVLGSFCDGQVDSLVRFDGNAPGLGSFEMTGSLFQTYSAFQPGNFFDISGPFIYDNGAIIADEVEAIFPNVVAFQWYYGILLNDNSILNGVGFVTLDEFNNAEFYLRGFDAVQQGNRFQITFTDDNDFITDDDASQELIDQFHGLMDEIFSGGEIYMIEGITVPDLFEFYNPCNGYTGFIFGGN